MQILVVAAITAAVFVLTFSGKDAAERLEKLPKWVLVVIALLPLGVLARSGLGAIAAGVGIGLVAGKRVLSLLAPKRAASPKVPPARPGGMTRKEALDVFGLSENASRQQILDEYRRLMKRVHPDQGGSEYLATRLNEAKDVLLGS